MTERGITAQAKQSSDAFSAGPLIIRATGVVMINTDPPTLLERLMAHPARMLLSFQKTGKLIPGQAVPSEAPSATLSSATPRKGRTRPHPGANPMILHRVG